MIQHRRYPTEWYYSSLAKRIAHVMLDGRKGKRCTTQEQGWAFEMKVTPIVISYIGF
jgi:hypothetical protein